MHSGIVTLAGDYFAAVGQIAAKRNLWIALFLATGIASGATLTTARQAHDLSIEKALLGNPVHLRAVVTYYDPYIDERRHALFVHDVTGAVFVALSTPPAKFLTAGTLVEIDGYTGAGDFAPIVDRAVVRIIGQSRVPAQAQPVVLSSMLTGSVDGQWVETEGVVHSIWEAGRNVNLELAMSDGSLTATTIKEPGVDYSTLIDSRIKLHANQAPVFNRHQQLTGARLFFPDMRQVQILEQGGDPFTLPALSVDHILRFTPNLTFSHRIRVRGVVSLQWPGRSLCVDEHGQGLCVQTSQDVKVPRGSEVDLVGFPSLGGLSPTLTDAAFRVVGSRPAGPAIDITAEEGLKGDYDSKLVRIKGTVMGKDRGNRDPTMILAAGKMLFSVVLPEGSVVPSTPLWEEGAILSVTGICSVRVEQKAFRAGYSVPLSFRILSQPTEDIRIVGQPSWWTAHHLLPLLAVVLGIALCALVWAAVLRHRLAEQTDTIRRQNAALMEISFQDSLTRVANRRRFDETLNSELQKAATVGKPISLLMIDIDHFKALNDEYGHPCGDECLSRVAMTLVACSVRDSDLVARYGGEEFAAILPGCAEEDAIAVAERMRAAVLALRIPNIRSPLDGCLSISVGAATIAPSAVASSASLVASADSALYQSKVLGRDRTTFFREACKEKSIAELQEA